MNKKVGDIFRTILGCYLIFIGICLWVQVSKTKPTNEWLMTVSAVILIAAGMAYALSALKKITGFTLTVKEKPDSKLKQEEQVYPDGNIRQKKDIMKNVQLMGGFGEEDDAVYDDPAEEADTAVNEKTDVIERTVFDEKKQYPERETRVIEKIEDLWVVAEGTAVSEEDEESGADSAYSDNVQDINQKTDAAENDYEEN